MGIPRPQLDEPAPLDNGDDRQNKDPRTGRFLPGNKAAKGRSRPYATRRAEIIRQFMSVPDEILKTIFDKLFEKAMEGDMQAIKEVLSRTMGQPQGYRPRGVGDIDFNQQQLDDEEPQPEIPQFMQDMMDEHDLTFAQVLRLAISEDLGLAPDPDTIAKLNRVG